MKVVGIESASLVASVAVVENDSLAAEYTVNFKKTHSQTLLPMVAEVAKMIDLDWDTVDAIAVSGGPGSFTGLRIGASIVNTLAYELNIPLYTHKGEKVKIIVPDYGRGANISSPRK